MLWEPIDVRRATALPARRPAGVLSVTGGFLFLAVMAPVLLVWWTMLAVALGLLACWQTIRFVTDAAVHAAEVLRLAPGALPGRPTWESYP